MASKRVFIQPKFPDGEFYLEALPPVGEDPWDVGPFTKDDFFVIEDGSLGYTGAGHPIHLKVRKQKGDILHANDGDLRDMDYRIVAADGRHE